MGRLREKARRIRGWLFRVCCLCSCAEDTGFPEPLEVDRTPDRSQREMIVFTFEDVVQEVIHNLSYSERAACREDPDLLGRIMMTTRVFSSPNRAARLAALPRRQLVPYCDHYIPSPPPEPESTPPPPSAVPVLVPVSAPPPSAVPVPDLPVDEFEPEDQVDDMLDYAIWFLLGAFSSLLFLY